MHMVYVETRTPFLTSDHLRSQENIKNLFRRSCSQSSKVDTLRFNKKANFQKWIQTTQEMFLVRL